jgi:hypothetical protein
MKTANNMIEQIRQANANREERRPSFAETQSVSPAIIQNVSQPHQTGYQDDGAQKYYPPPSYPPPSEQSWDKQQLKQPKGPYSPPEGKIATPGFINPITQKVSIRLNRLIITDINYYRCTIYVSIGNISIAKILMTDTPFILMI